MKRSILAHAALGGANVLGTLGVANSKYWVVAPVIAAVAVSLLVHAWRLLSDMEQAMEIMYNGPYADELYVDPEGPFGGMLPSRQPQ